MDERHLMSSCKELVFLEMKDTPFLFVGLYMSIFVDFQFLSWRHYFMQTLLWSLLENEWKRFCNYKSISLGNTME